MSSALVSYTSPEELAAIEAVAKAANLHTHLTSTTEIDVYSLDTTAISSWLEANPTLNVDVAPILMAPRMRRPEERAAAAAVKPRTNTLSPHTVGVPYFFMDEIVSIYNIPPPVNTPVCVGVVSFGGGLFGSVNNQGVLTNGDVQSYWSSIGIAPANHPKVIIVTLPGASNNPNIFDGGATMENTMDVETIGGACPTSNLTIILYISPNSLSAFPTLLNYIYTTNVVVNSTSYKPSMLSISWGAPEIYYGSSLINSINSQFSRMTENNMNICVATGDNGSNNGVGGSANYVDYPSSSPFTTAVGGTTLICPNNVYDASTIETGWSSGGGGVSTQNAKPSYQSSITAAGRSTPDIAAVADPSTGVVFTLNGSYAVVGGTSLAAPIVIAFLAAINCQGFINPKLYTANSNCFHDVKTGSNGGFSASNGYDNCTGFGSFNGAILRAALSPIVTTALTTLPTSVTVPAGQTVTVVPVFTPQNASNKTLTWSSLNPAIASVNTSGVINGVAVGTTVVEARTVDGSNITASVPVTVSNPLIAVTSVSVNVIPDLHVPNTHQLVETVLPANATIKTLTYTSNKPSIATVNSNGLVTAVAIGSAQITARSNNNKTASTNVNVIVPVSAVTLSANTIDLSSNQTTTLVATVLPSNAGNKAVIWSSGNNSVATVSSFIRHSVYSATVRGITNGTTTITAQTQDMGLIASATVNVITKVISATLNTATLALNPTQTSQLTVTVNPVTATNKTVTWSSSNASIATVTVNGLVTAIANGTATISVVTNEGGKRANTTVNVTTRATGVTLSSSNLTIGKNNSSTLVPVVSPPAASNKSVTWASSNTSVAKVNTRGVVSGVRTGIATITVRTTDGNFSASCVITVP